MEEVEDKIAANESYRTEGDKVVKSLDTGLAALRTEWLEFQIRYRRAAARLDRLAPRHPSNAPRVRPATGLKPETIGRDVSPAEFRVSLSKM